MNLLVTLAESLLTEEQREVMNTLERKHASYLQQGRGREAHGVRSAMLLVLHHFMGGRRVDFQLTEPGDGPDAPA